MKPAFISVLLIACLAAGCARDPKKAAAKHLRTGKDYLAAKDYARAEIEFKNALKLFPKDAESQYELGVVWLAEGHLNAAVAAVFRATQLDPNHQGAKLKLAEMMARSGDEKLEKESEKRMQEFLAAAPGNTDALNVLALSELFLGESDDAERHLREALGKLPGSLRSSVELANVYLRQQDMGHAEEVLKQAVAAAPNSADAAVALGQFYVMTKRWPEAETAFGAAAKIAPKDAPVLMALAGVQARLGKNVEAERTYLAVSELPDTGYKHVHAAWLFSTGRREEGLKELEKLAKGAPHNRDVRTRLVEAYLSSGRAQDADKVLDAALKENANDVDAQLQRSGILLREGRLQDAEARLLEVIHFKPDSADAHYMLAQVYRSRGERPRENAELSDALRYNPGLVAARVELAQLLTLSGSPSAAADLLNAVPEAQKGNLSIALQRNLANYVANDMKEFREGVAQSLKLARVPDTLLQDAVVKLMDKDYAGARASIDEAMKQRPDDLRALKARAYTYSAQNQPAEALKFLGEYAAQSKSPAVEVFVGESLLSAGKSDQARAAFDRAKTLAPRYVPADLALAQTDIVDGKTEAARTTLDQVLSTDPNNLQGHSLLATLESRAGNSDAALDQYRKVVELNPRNVVALNNLAYLLVDTANQPDEALKYAQQAKEAAPDNADINGTLGWAFYRKGFYKDAVQYLQQAVARDGASAQPNAVVRKYHLAMAYLKMGDRDRGLKILTPAFQANPRLPEAAMAQRVLAETGGQPF